jgi:hypothetical protein
MEFTHEHAEACRADIPTDVEEAASKIMESAA